MQEDKPALFELVNDTGINFENKVNDSSDDNCFLYRNFYNGGGVAIGDINNDGLADVMFTSNMSDNKLYLNKGNFKFEDITAISGLKQDSLWCTGVSFVDINHDGWLDIYVCSSGHINKGNRKNKLYINNHNNSFTEQAAKYGLDYSGYCTQASFFDYDMDGDLDCFIIDNSPIPFSSLNYANMRDVPEADWKVTANYKGGGNHLFKNDNDHFTEVTEQAGIHTSLISFGLGVSVGDINNDGYPDIYVGNDFIERDYLYINQKNGKFKDELQDYMQHTSMSSMSTDLGDINNDGYPDIYTTDMLPEDDYRLKTTGVFDNIDLYRSKIKAGFYYQYVKNCLQLNNGNGRFTEIANYSGISATDWSWGSLIFDADNDGWNDIYVCNGINRDLSNLDFLDFFSNDIYQKMLQTGRQADVNELLQKIPRTPLLNKAYKNLGNLKFADEGKQWGFTQTSFSNAVAYGDLDNDGDLDIVVNNENMPSFVYRNSSNTVSKNHFVSLQLKADAKNTFAIGSKIQLYTGKQILTREVIPVRGFQSSVDYKQVIGLGSIASIDSMKITWPNRNVTLLRNPAMDTLHIIQQPAGSTQIKEAIHVAGQTLLQQVPITFDKHTEDDYVDFYTERNIPRMLSRQGPKAACADVNGDHLEDIYICGATGQGGQLYLQNASDGFTKSIQKDFELYKDFEDVTALFFDCDADGDNDLFVAAGGNNVMQSSRQLQHRLYKNDGKGNFIIDGSAFPSSQDNTGIVAACDFDNDGDIDLFVGALSVPKVYGITPLSHIYVNDGKGRFSDMSVSKMGGIDNAGMITAAVWADINADNKKDLVIAGEWMSPHIYTYKTDHFEELKSNLNDLSGMWRAVAVSDLNSDGKTDLVLGNIGENFYLNPAKERPSKIWINDFDKNGSVDKIITYTVNGKDAPVFLKHDMQEQIPSIKKQNLKQEDYANKSMQQLFPNDITHSQVKEFNYASSCVAINNGNGNFTIEKLPPSIQWSCVNAIYCTDLNQDGFTDIITGGNDFDFVPQLQRLDACLGNVLLNNGKGNFIAATAKQSGLQLTGVVRDIQEIVSANNKYLLFLRNDEYPALYKIAK